MPYQAGLGQVGQRHVVELQGFGPAVPRPPPLPTTAAPPSRVFLAPPRPLARLLQPRQRGSLRARRRGGGSPHGLEVGGGIFAPSRPLGPLAEPRGQRLCPGWICLATQAREDSRPVPSPAPRSAAPSAWAASARPVVNSDSDQAGGSPPAAAAERLPALPCRADSCPCPCPGGLPIAAHPWLFVCNALEVVKPIWNLGADSRLAIDPSAKMFSELHPVLGKHWQHCKLVYVHPSQLSGNSVGRVLEASVQGWPSLPSRKSLKTPTRAELQVALNKTESLSIESCCNRVV